MSAPKESTNNVNDRASFSALAGPKRNLGRAARRRRQKLMEIQRAEEQLLQNHHQQSSSATQASSEWEGEESVEDNNSSLDNQNQVIPSDRGIVWPGVEEHRNTADGNASWEKDASMLLSQLGYVPGNAIKVAARVSDVPLLQEYSCHGEEPVVLQLYPIALRDEHAGGKAKRKFKQRKRKKQLRPQAQANAERTTHEVDSDAVGATTNTNADPDQQTPCEEEDDFVVEPFPTLYWLTHPLLRILVSKMELQGLGIQLEQQLTKDEDAMESIERANRAYGQERYDLLTSNDMDYIQQRNWEGAFDPNRGVAGIRNFASVKCLHAHAAHYLSNGEGSQDNILGKWVIQEISKTISAPKN